MVREDKRLLTSILSSSEEERKKTGYGDADNLWKHFLPRPCKGRGSR
jgi:hypothetical protein